MAQEIAYYTGSVDNTVKKGNFAIAVNNTAYNNDPNTEFYAGIDPPDGGYTIYVNKASNGPSIFTTSTEAELINITRELSGTTYNNTQECIQWFSTQNDKLIVASTDNYKNIITSGSVLNLDASVLGSYPTTGSIWYDLSGNNNSGSLINGPTFSDGSIVFDGVNDSITIPSLASNSFTYNLLFKKTSTSSSCTSLISNEGTLLRVNNTQILWWSNVLVGQVTYNFTPNLNQWYNITVVQNNTSAKIYLDTNLIIDTTTSLPNTTYGRNTIGSWGGNCPWLGNISSAQIYNRALTESEILQNFAASGYPRLVEDVAGTTDPDFSRYTGRVVNTLTSQDLYSSSSLVLTAAGYGTGSLYALKPVITGITSSRASTSTRLTNGGNLLEIATNVPNISYPYTNNQPYYLVEPQSTNLLTYSNNPFNNSNNWGNRQIENVTATLYDTIGDINILKLTEGTNNGQHRVGSGANYTGGNYTGTKIWTSSFYAKPNGRSRIVIYLNSSLSGYIDLEAGTTTLTPSGYLKKSKVTKLTNGYCYVEITFSKTNATSGPGPYYIEWLADNNNNSSYQGDGTSGILMYGYQIEEMQFGTSYIKTNAGSTVTRTASSRGTHLTGLQSKGILSSTGTVYIEGFYKGTSTYYQYVFGQTGASGFSGVSISTNQRTPSSTYSFSMRIYKSGGFIGDKTLDSSYYDGKPFKICFKYDGTNCHFFYNGVYKGYLQFSGASIDRFFTGTENTSGNTAGNGSCLGISSMFMFPTALSDDQCLTLTR